jgi:hypothetical protein
MSAGLRAPGRREGLGGHPSSACRDQLSGCGPPARSRARCRAAPGARRLKHGWLRPALPVCHAPPTPSGARLLPAAPEPGPAGCRPPTQRHLDAQLAASFGIRNPVPRTSAGRFTADGVVGGSSCRGHSSFCRTMDENAAARSWLVAGAARTGARAVSHGRPPAARLKTGCHGDRPLCRIRGALPGRFNLEATGP